MPNDDESEHKTTAASASEASAAAAEVIGESVQMRTAAFEQRSTMNDELTSMQRGDDNVKRVLATIARNSFSRDNDIPPAANTQVCHTFS